LAKGIFSKQLCTSLDECLGCIWMTHKMQECVGLRIDWKGEGLCVSYQYIESRQVWLVRQGQLREEFLCTGMHLVHVADALGLGANQGDVLGS
jgi:hypothetical protein